jgi:hypothetical protein
MRLALSGKSAGLPQDLPVNLTAWPSASTPTQNVDEGHDTELRDEPYGSMFLGFVPWAGTRHRPYVGSAARETDEMGLRPGAGNDRGRAQGTAPTLVLRLAKPTNWRETRIP